MATKFLYEQESYLIRKAIYALYKEFRNAYKESVYHNALIQLLSEEGFTVEKNKQLPVYFHDKKVGVYTPDIIINGIILIELKCKPILTKGDQQQFWEYLKSSKYRVGF